MKFIRFYQDQEWVPQLDENSILFYVTLMHKNDDVDITKFTHVFSYNLNKHGIYNLRIYIRLG